MGSYANIEVGLLPLVCLGSTVVDLPHVKLVDPKGGEYERLVVEKEKVGQVGFLKIASTHLLRVKPSTWEDLPTLPTNLVLGTYFCHMPKTETSDSELVSASEDADLTAVRKELAAARLEIQQL